MGWLFAFWATPVISVYILMAIQFEEKDLVDVHGEEYRRYQKRVPMILPLRIARERIEQVPAIGK